MITVREFVLPDTILYQVLKDNKRIDGMFLRKGHKRLTWSEQNDIAAGYKEYYDDLTPDA